MILEVWKSDFLLPSVDAKCLQFLVCARMCAAPVQKLYGSRPWTTPTGDYPVFKFIRAEDGEQCSTGDFKQFREYLKKSIDRCTIDSHLSDAELCELTAFESMVEQNLLPAYLHCLWVDEYNSSCMINRWYGQQLMFPYGLYYVHKRKHAASLFIQSLFGPNSSEKHIELLVMKRALTCINLLSAKLDDKKYFCGNKPTSFDALVFGYLAPLLRLPLPNDLLQSHIKACPNLVRFVESIISIYLPLSEAEISTQQQNLKPWLDSKVKVQSEIRKRIEVESADKESTDAYPLRDKVLFGLTAAFLSVFVAIHVGLIKVDIMSSISNDSAESAETRDNREKRMRPSTRSIEFKSHADY